MLSDNGAAFTHRLINPDAAPSRFTRTVNDWGTRLIHSSPYHPQTCGKVERHHQTLHKWLATQPTPTNLRHLQRQLDTYREHYNTGRGHSAHPGRSTPHHAWTTAATLGGPSNLPIQTDASVHPARVAANGTIGVGRHLLGVGRVHHGATFTAIRDGSHATVYHPDGLPIGHAYLDPTKKYIPLTKITDR